MRGTFYLSDVFVELHDSRYKTQLKRFLELIFGRPFVTQPERSMQCSWHMLLPRALLRLAAKSAPQSPPQKARWLPLASTKCRQSTGAAYAGKAMRTTIGIIKWGRIPIMRIGKENCRQRHRKPNSKILDESKGEEVVPHRHLQQTTSSGSDVGASVQTVLAELKSKAVLTSSEDVRRLVGASDLREITEYGRAVHAEMDAILTCARLGVTTRGSI